MESVDINTKQIKQENEKTPEDLELLFETVRNNLLESLQIAQNKGDASEVSKIKESLRFLEAIEKKTS